MAKWFFILLLLLSSTAFADEKLTGEFATMSCVCQFNADQQTKLYKIQMDLDRALKKIDTLFKAKFDTVPKIKDAVAQVIALNNIAEQIRISKENENIRYRVIACGLMTQEQKVLWSTHKIIEIISKKYEITPQVKEICVGYGKKIPPEKLDVPGILKPVEDEIENETSRRIP